MHPHIHAHTKWTCRICRSVYWLSYLWRRCAFWKRCFCSPLFYGDFTFSISSKQHFFLRSSFSPLFILFTECSDANSSNKSWRVALFRVSHSKRSVQTLHNTFSLFPTALSKCTNAFHFIWKRCSPFSLFISVARAHTLSFCTIFESLFRHSCKRFHIIHFFFSAAYCGKQCFIQVNATRWNKSYTLRKWVRMSVWERKSSARSHPPTNINKEETHVLSCMQTEHQDI